MTLARRGYSAVGLYRPKDPANVGGALRAACVYGAALVVLDDVRGRALRHPADTTKASRHIPCIVTDDILKACPFDAQMVVVDLIPGATPLPDFKHPSRAFYVFGPEDGTLGARHTSLAQHVVYVPGTACMNLAATVNVVLYDRMVKRREWRGSSEVERQTENLGAGGSIPPLATTLGEATDEGHSE